MRQIEVDIDVFAEIWGRRLEGEMSENEILKRVLVDWHVAPARESLQAKLNICDSEERAVSQEMERCQERWTLKAEAFANTPESPDEHPLELGPDVALGKVRWIDDVVAALRSMGGRANLGAIYRYVERQRKLAGRSVPKTLDAVIRRTIEDHSSDSANYKGRDLFGRSSRGEWFLR